MQKRFDFPGFGPYEWLRFSVVQCEVTADRAFEFNGAAMSTAADLPLGSKLNGASSLAASVIHNCASKDSAKTIQIRDIIFLRVTLSIIHHCFLF
jgi:hypothetical protein